MSRAEYDDINLSDRPNNVAVRPFGPNLVFEKDAVRPFGPNLVFEKDAVQLFDDESFDDGESLVERDESFDDGESLVERDESFDDGESLVERSDSDIDILDALDKAVPIDDMSDNDLFSEDEKHDIDGELINGIDAAAGGDATTVAAKTEEFDDDARRDATRDDAVTQPEEETHYDHSFLSKTAVRSDGIEAASKKKPKRHKKHAERQIQLSVNPGKDLNSMRPSVREFVFSKIYANRVWGDGKVVPLSGNGSSLEITRACRTIIIRVIKDYQLRSMLDIACGDMTWMPEVLNELRREKYKLDFIGCEIVTDLVEKHKKKFAQYNDMRFEQADMVKGVVEKADLILCRDVIQHLTIPEGLSALNNISGSGAKFLLATTYPRQSEEMNMKEIGKTGYCMSRNLMGDPFNLPDPIAMYSENNTNYHKYLGLWELPFPAVRTKYEQKN